MGSHLVLLSLVASLAGAPQTQPIPAPWLLDHCNVVWTTPSDGPSGSMPIGNGEVGLNVWVEKGGDVLFYVSRTDAWSENARLLKLGRVRMRITPNPFGEGVPFKQKLWLSQGEIVIQGGPVGHKVQLTFSIEPNQPTAHVFILTDEPISLQVDLERWRTEKRRLEGRELQSAYGLGGDNPDPVYVEPDILVSHQKNAIVWYHRNEESIWTDNLKLQGLDDLVGTVKDPLLHHTFGGLIKGRPLLSASDTSLKSVGPRRLFLLDIHTATGQTQTPEEWLAALQDQVRANDKALIQSGRDAHKKWWAEFWQRSWIYVTGRPDGKVEAVSRGYALQRFMNACAGRGAYPIKFNGSIFTVDAKDGPQSFDADYRRWGGPYWFQNTRLGYWPMLAAGDFDLMEPLFRMYLDAEPLARARTPLYYGHDGIFFPETIYFWGTYASENYGWQREGKPLGLTDNRYIRYYFDGGLELSLMMLDYCAYAGKTAFLREKVLPFVDGIITFYDRHYPRDDQGRLRIEPSQALETYWDVPNPAPVIAGLKAVLTRLADLPEDLTTAPQRERWRRLLGELPPLPMRTMDGQQVLSPAEVLHDKTNAENPELYAVFPYRLFGVGREGLDLARRTFEHRVHKGTGGWQQDAIQAACLGLTDAAARDVVHNFTTHDPNSRFPAFWGPNYDWVPDQDHGGVAMIALQRMLLQADGRSIHLLPAWPADWDVDFKLHAPLETTVRAVYQAGRLTTLEVDPPERKKDIVRP